MGYLAVDRSLIATTPTTVFKSFSGGSTYSELIAAVCSMLPHRLHGGNRTLTSDLVKVIDEHDVAVHFANLRIDDPAAIGRD